MSKQQWYDDGEPVTWEEPPQVHLRGSVSWTEQAAALRAHPKRWGVVTEFPEGHGHRASSMAHHIKRGKLAAFQPPGSFDAMARNCKVYARYMGP